MGKKVRKKFVCRHCGKLVYVDGISHIHPGEHLNVRVMSQGGKIESYVCNECDCTKFNLSQKVQEYSEKAPLPKLVEQSMRFIVNAGNAMAHDKKNQNDDLIRLKVSDCDKLLEALEIIFDHVFIQPKKEALMGKNVERVTPKSKKVST